MTVENEVGEREQGVDARATQGDRMFGHESKPPSSLVVVFVARWWVVQCKQGYSQSPLSDSGVVSMTGAPVARC